MVRIIHIDYHVILFCSTLCEQKTVKQAYHQLCQPCAEMKGVCAKCVKNTHIVERYYISATVYSCLSVSLV